MKVFFSAALLAVFYILEINACHNVLHLSRRKRSTDSESEDNVDVLITFFTDCMNSTSNITFDWFSATDWTVADSNWYYYTDKTDCAGELLGNETECWKQRIELFVDEEISPAVKNCIESYAKESEKYERVAESKQRKKRQIRRGGIRRQLGGGRGVGRGAGPIGGNRRGSGRNEGVGNQRGNGRSGNMGNQGGNGGNGRSGNVGNQGGNGENGRSGNMGNQGGNGGNGRSGNTGNQGSNGGDGRSGNVKNQGGNGGNGRSGNVGNQGGNGDSEINGRNGEVGGNAGSTGAESKMQGAGNNGDINPNGVNGEKNKNSKANNAADKPKNPKMPGKKQPKPFRMHPRNSECPAIPNDYRVALNRLVPRNFRPRRRKQRRFRRSDSEWNFNISSVVDFVDRYAKCEECARYTGSSGIACFTDRFDRLTRYDSPLKARIQKVNSQFSEGGDTVGNCGNTYWTEWFNIDNPTTGVGDNESLTQIKSRYPGKVCSNPSGIQAQLSRTGQPFGRGNNSIDVSPELGLFCLNVNQTNGRCQDYRVRFCCKEFVGQCPINHGWTQYFDNQNPSLIGDFEFFSTRLAKNNEGRLCRHPTAISGWSITTNRTYQLTGEKIRISVNRGLFCVAALQRDRRCEDYKVRYCCSSIIGSCPSGRHWTKWFNSRPDLDGDDESLSRIKRKKGYRCGSEPTAIEAQIVGSNQPYINGNNKLTISPEDGLICKNRLQEEGTCKNYRVRFCCQLVTRNPNLPPPTTQPPPPPLPRRPLFPPRGRRAPPPPRFRPFGFAPRRFSPP